MTEIKENGHAAEPFTAPWDGATSRVWRRPELPSLAAAADTRLLGRLLRDEKGRFAIIVDIEDDAVIMRDGTPVRHRVPIAELGTYRVPAPVEWALATMPRVGAAESKEAPKNSDEELE